MYEGLFRFTTKKIYPKKIGLSQICLLGLNQFFHVWQILNIYISIYTTTIIWYILILPIYIDLGAQILVTSCLEL